MGFSESYKDFLFDQLAGFGSVTIRRMFGGGGVYLDGLMFGLVYDDMLYLKADATSQAAFETAGSRPFVYQPGNGKSVQMSYWRAPEICMDDQTELLQWCEKAMQAAVRAAQKKPKPKPKPKK